MRVVVVVGASGNVGTALARRLDEERDIELVGVARRVPARRAVPVADWRARDIGRDDLTEVFSGADAVVHLAWQIQPSHDLARLTLTNITGSARVFDAVARAGVATLVYASSVGTYARGPKSGRVDESWPTDGTRAVPPPAAVARAAVAATWRLRVQPTPSGWLDLALGVPLMDCERARRDLGWQAVRSSEEALLELIDGLRHGTSVATPPLEPDGRLVPVSRR
jgi:nucleoside-diphosphate-sugar epimerase